MSLRALLIVAALALPITASAQSPADGAADRLRIQEAAARTPEAAVQPFTAMTGADRISWIVVGTVGVRSLSVGVVAASFDTWIDVPREWQRSWEGFGKRYAQREADVAISNTIEAGLGALWGEQARYTRSDQRGFRRRLGHALQTVMLAERADGHLGPAWARYAGNVFNNVIENTWLPPSVATWQATATGAASGMASRALSNVWEEFAPDLRRRLFK